MKEEESGKCHFQLRRERRRHSIDILLAFRNLFTIWNISHWYRMHVHLTLIISSFHCFDEWSILKNWHSLSPSSEWIRILLMVCNCMTRFFGLCREWTNCTLALREQESNDRVISFSRPTTRFSAVSSEDNLDQSVHTSMPLQSGTFERVRTLFVAEVRSFEHEFFRIISQSFPVLRSLHIFNGISQESNTISKNSDHIHSIAFFWPRRRPRPCELCDALSHRCNYSFWRTLLQEKWCRRR